MTMFLAIISTAISALNNCLIDLKLKQYDVIGLMLAFHLSMLPFLLLRAFHVGWHNIRFPEGNGVLFVFLGGFLYFLTDLCYFGAYNRGADVALMTVACAVFPTLALSFKCIWTQTWPMWHQAASCILAAIAIKLSAE